MSPVAIVAPESVLKDDEIRSKYHEYKSEASSFAALATCKTLIHFLETDNSLTLQEFSLKIKHVISELKKIEFLTEVESLSEIFLRFITLTAAEYGLIDEVRKALKSRANLFLKKVIHCKQSIARYGQQFISEGSSILVHSYSSCVLATLLEAHRQQKLFTVYVTKSEPTNSGIKLYEALLKHEIRCFLILDAAVGYCMEMVDMVMVGAEGVVENGGIINKIGTFPLALCAKTMNKPFYVLAESYKFVRHFSLTQADIPDTIKFKHAAENPKNKPCDSIVDYTPPAYITLLHTDLGTITTAAVSDVLIQLYL